MHIYKKYCTWVCIHFHIYIKPLAPSFYQLLIVLSVGLRPQGFFPDYAGMSINVPLVYRTFGQSCWWGSICVVSGMPGDTTSQKTLWSYSFCNLSTPSMQCSRSLRCWCSFCICVPWYIAPKLCILFGCGFLHWSLYFSMNIFYDDYWMCEYIHS